MSTRHATTGSSNLLLMALVAMSAYVKFETAAKTTLVVSVYLFVVDPLPPISRLVAIISCLLVLVLNRWYQTALAQQQAENNVQIEEEEEEGGGGEGEESKNKKKKKKQ
mmetsp:Transcript_39150/g.94657  ORF Transcript_39150/g.94657 Transcript_39150/m.94657 type:complete len:109 (+) Transcript_39150:318-644(+)|eukprot:CAMPEP_0113460576 /NCGR_PEP_ID=MMETSP0014_2-20120614/11065_1 /TAXON_ID=2857 /ORGANISM="Nitzschia sp." /LENGTH=108 /DNA_ID=CAMNT_0000352247 /DNA_START=372 /DNA_END=698 /DNA_ORIENTATION=- /assembly_acc=CAM_ASM_000159